MIRYCSNCGFILDWKLIEEKRRLYCKKCQFIYYPQLKVGAGGLIEQDGKLLLIQRTKSPFRDYWNLPAGYVEVDENPIQTAKREVYEETGLKVDIEMLVDVYFFDDDPRGNGILIVYKCSPKGGRLIETAEAVNPHFFKANDIPEYLAGGGHDKAIMAWKEK